MRLVALLNNPNLLRRQPVKLVHQPIDLPLQQLLGRGRLGIGNLLAQRQQGLYRMTPAQNSGRLCLTSHPDYAIIESDGRAGSAAVSDAPWHIRLSSHS